MARTDFLFDTALPYKWSDTYIAFLLTQAEREACKRASLILDRGTQTSSISASGTSTGTTANKLVDSAAVFTTAMVGTTVYNVADNTWAVITARDSGTVLSLSADIMVSGETYVIGDATKALTRVCIEKDKATYSMSDKITKIKSCYLKSQGPLHPLTQAIVVNSNTTGTPTKYVEGKRFIISYPISQVTDTLNLEVYRLPINDLALTDASVPEIDDEYHFPLIHYVCAMAFLKQDDRSIDHSKSAWHEAQFAEVFGPKVSEHLATILRQTPSNFKLAPANFGL